MQDAKQPMKGFLFNETIEHIKKVAKSTRGKVSLSAFDVTYTAFVDALGLDPDIEEPGDDAFVSGRNAIDLRIKSMLREAHAKDAVGFLLNGAIDMDRVFENYLGGIEDGHTVRKFEFLGTTLYIDNFDTCKDHIERQRIFHAEGEGDIWEWCSMKEARKRLHALNEGRTANLYEVRELTQEDCHALDDMD